MIHKNLIPRFIGDEIRDAMIRNGTICKVMATFTVDATRVCPVCEIAYLDQFFERAKYSFGCNICSYVCRRWIFDGKKSQTTPGLAMCDDCGRAVPSYLCMLYRVVPSRPPQECCIECLILRFLLYKGTISPENAAGIVRRCRDCSTLLRLSEFFSRRKEEGRAYYMLTCRKCKDVKKIEKRKLSGRAALSLENVPESAVQAGCG